MVTDRDECGSCKRFTDLLRISYKLAECPKDRFVDEKTALRIGILTVFFFNPQTLSVSISSRSDYVLGDISWCGSIKNERDATRTSRMGLRIIRTLTDELQKSYRY